MNRLGFAVNCWISDRLFSTWTPQSKTSCFLGGLWTLQTVDDNCAVFDKAERREKQSASNIDQIITCGVLQINAAHRNAAALPKQSGYCHRRIQRHRQRDCQSVWYCGYLFLQCLCLLRLQKGNGALIIFCVFFLVENGAKVVFCAIGGRCWAKLQNT